MRLDTRLYPGPGCPLSPLEDGGGWSAPEAMVRARLGAGSRSGVYHQPVTVARPLGAPVPPVLGVGRHPAPRDPQARQDDALVGADGPDLRVLNLTRPHVVDSGRSLHDQDY